jgi:rod shape-determining protein MreC
METILGRFRNLIVLAAILFAQIVGLAVQVKRPAQQGDTRLIRVWAVGAITPFEKGVVNTQKFFYNTWHNYIYLRGVRRENRELRAELDRMKLEQVRLKEDAEMARRIQSLLAFKEQHIDSTVAAQVIGTSGSDQSRVLYIDKGSKQGIKNDMAVITPNGVVGKVVQVFPESAQVLPINDQLSGVGVTLTNTRLQGILRGGPNGTTTVQYVMADERVVPGEEVITSGGDRIFPKGLPVGKVVDVKPGRDLFLSIRVSPSSQLDRLEEVLVVTKVMEKPPDVHDLGPIRVSDILAQRLPTLPDKPQVDAAGKPITAQGTSGPQGTPAAGASASSAGTAASGTRPGAPGAASNRGAPGVGTTTRPATATNGLDAAGAAAIGTRTTTGATKPATASSTSTGTAGAAAAVKKPGTTTPTDTETQAPLNGASASPEASPSRASDTAEPKAAKPTEENAPPRNSAPSKPPPDNPQR